MNHHLYASPVDRPDGPLSSSPRSSAFVVRFTALGSLRSLLFTVMLGSCPAVILAEETFTSHVSALAGITIAGDTDFSGPVWIGRLAEDATAKGFKMDVFQDAQTYYEEVYHEGGYTMESHWVEDGYYQTEYAWVDVYDWVSYSYMTPDEVDENGNVITSGEWVDDWQWESVGMEEQMQEVWVSSGGHEEQTEVWNEPYYESVQHTSFGAPEVRFTGTRSNTNWTWSNPSSAAGGSTRDLMRLSSGGLSLPMPGDATGVNRALLTHSSLEHSYTSPTDAGPYQSFGSKVRKDKIELWSHQGTSYDDTVGDGSTHTVIEDKLETELDAVGLSLSSSESTDGGASMVRTTTTITATSASFAGSVGVKGVLRVEPAGDLAMGVYTSGPRP